MGTQTDEQTSTTPSGSELGTTSAAVQTDLQLDVADGSTGPGPPGPPPPPVHEELPGGNAGGGDTGGDGE